MDRHNLQKDFNVDKERVLGEENVGVNEEGRKREKLQNPNLVTGSQTGSKLVQEDIDQDQGRPQDKTDPVPSQTQNYS